MSSKQGQPKISVIIPVLHLIRPSNLKRFFMPRYSIVEVLNDLKKQKDEKTITADHLVQLANAFAQFAKGRPLSTQTEGELIDGEYTPVLNQLGLEEPSKKE